MASQSVAVWQVVVGPGPKLGGLQPLLSSLAGSLPVDRPVRARALVDLDELLARFTGEGRLILDTDHLLLEEIGFVRRFLSNHPAWHLFLVGTNAQSESARAALGLPRASWLSWPPNIDQLQDLLRPSATPADDMEPRAARERLGEIADLSQRLELSLSALRDSPGTSRREIDACLADLGRLRELALGRRPRAQTSPPEAAGNSSPALSSSAPSEEVDLAVLLEEELATLTVRDRRAPRYQYRNGGALPMRGAPGELREAFRAILLLVRAASSEGEIIRVQANPGGDDQIQVEIDAPPGTYQELGHDLGRELSARDWNKLSDLADRSGEVDVKALQSAVETLNGHGGEIEGGLLGDGRQRIRVRLPRKQG